MDIVGNLINWIATKSVLLNSHHAEQQNTQLLTNESTPSDLVEAITNKRAAPTLLEACYMLVRFMDMSNSIHNAFKNVLPMDINNIVTCYFHVCQNFQKTIPEYSTKVKAFVHKLHLWQSKLSFDLLCALITYLLTERSLAKDVSIKAAKLLSDRCKDKWNHWYIGACKFVGSRKYSSIMSTTL